MNGIDEEFLASAQEKNEPVNWLFINALSDKYSSCNVDAIGDTRHTTVQDMDQIPPMEHDLTLCVVYCAHEDCDAAKNFAKQNKEEMERVCNLGSFYLSGGARYMMEEHSDLIRLQNSEECSILLKK